jgi:hypothetical protein
VRFGLVLAALFFALTAAARAGTYDVVTCSPGGPGGVNNAWVATPVENINGPPEDAHQPGYALIESCATGGPMIRSGMGATFAYWGTWKDLEFRAPADTRIARLALWREAYGQGTASGGNWRVRAIVDQDTPLGGSFGPDQCKTGEPFHPSTCRVGGSAYGDAAATRYDLAATRLRVGLECFAPQLRSCDTNGSGAPFGSYRLKAAVVTIRDDTLPALEAAGPLFEAGWRRLDSDLAISAGDNTGIKSVRLLVDGQERSRVDPACDYTFPRPCADTGGRRLGLGSAPIADGSRQVQVVAEDAAGNLASVTRAVMIDAHGPTATLARSSGRTISVRVGDGASGVATGTIEVRNRPSEPFRALPTTLSGGRLTARLDRGRAARVGIRVTVTDHTGNVTSGQLNQMSLRVRGRSLRGGAASVGYGRSARVTGQLLTRDDQPIGGRPITIESTPRVSGATRQVVATVTTNSRGRFAYRAPAGVSRTLRFTFGGASDLVALTRSASLRVRASSTIRASRRVLSGRGRVRFSGRLGLRGATTPRSGKIVELQAYDGGRWRIFATARARGSKGRWSAAYTFAGTPGRYPVRLRIRREAVFPYDLGYSRSVVIRVR